MYEPTPSADHEGRYMTFLEMLNAEDKASFAKPNEHLPSKSVGKCEMCPDWQFSSVTEAKRHVSLIHPNYRKEILPGTDQVFKCKFEKCVIYFQHITSSQNIGPRKTISFVIKEHPNNQHRQNR